MSQLIEGVDNEITLAFILFSGAFAIAVPWYFFRPRTNIAAPGTVNNTRNVQDDSQNNAAAPDSRNNERRYPGNAATYTETPNSNDAGNSNPDHCNTQHLPSSSSAEDNIVIRVKLHELDNEFTISKHMKLGEFKRYCFRTQTQEGKNVRLIYNGRILEGDSSPLEFFGLSNGCTVHAQVSDHQQNTSSQFQQQDENDLDIGYLFVPSITFALILGWVAVLAYDEIFSTISILILALLSGIFVLLAYIV